MRDFLTIPQEFDINPEFPHGEIYSCYNTLRLESQRVGTLLSVINGIGATTGKQARVATWSRLGPGGPLMCFFISYCYSEKIMTP
jgi:hypothetical protein